ncbi:UNVERIFIED_CONTAM: Non-specific lipid-transfer protein-like protein, partial [Sesamum latifolium]
PCRLPWPTSYGALSQPLAGGPSPGWDCSTLIYDMIDCMPFLSNGGQQMKPDESCCSGLRAVVETDADCICYAVNSAAVSSTPGSSPANPPKAIGAPSHSPNIPPTARPPVAAVSSTPARAPVPQAPAPSPKSSSAYAMSTVSALFSVSFTIILFLVL